MLPHKQKRKPFIGRRNTQLVLRRLDTQHNPFSETENTLNTINNWQWSGILHNHRIGQQPSNQTQYRQRFTGYIYTEVTVQQKKRPLHFLETQYRDVNDNRIQFEGKTTTEVEINRTQRELEILVTTKKTNPLLCLNWMKRLGITLETGKTVPQIHQVKKTRISRH